MATPSLDSATGLPVDLLRQFDVPGPRYTSYPTADRFVEAFGPADYEQALRQRAQGAVVGGKPPLSVYVHIPFCESVCYYCACNKVITRHHERAAEYLLAMRAEIASECIARGLGTRQAEVHGAERVNAQPLWQVLQSPSERELVFVDPDVLGPAARLVRQLVLVHVVEKDLACIARAHAKLAVHRTR